MPRVRAVAVPIASLACAILLTFPLAKHVVHSRDLLFVVAVVIAARYSGSVAGLLVALVSVLTFDWFFDSSPHRLDFTVGGLLRAASFSSLAVLIAFLERQRTHAIERLEGSNRRLQSALEEVKTLRGILPTCMYCKQIRTETNRWMEIEDYVRQHSDAQFSHGVCPTCLRRHYPEIYEKRKAPEP